MLHDQRATLLHAGVVHLVAQHVHPVAADRHHDVSEARELLGEVVVALVVGQWKPRATTRPHVPHAVALVATGMVPMQEHDQRIRTPRKAGRIVHVRGEFDLAPQAGRLPDLLAEVIGGAGNVQWPVSGAVRLARVRRPGRWHGPQRRSRDLGRSAAFIGHGQVLRSHLRIRRNDLEGPFVRRWDAVANRLTVGRHDVAQRARRIVASDGRVVRGRRRGLGGPGRGRRDQQAERDAQREGAGYCATGPWPLIHHPHHRLSGRVRRRG